MLSDDDWGVIRHCEMILDVIWFDDGDFMYDEKSRLLKGYV